jgi:hypothetical protein
MALYLAVSAAFWFVLEILLVIELLFPCGEHEISAAFDASQNPVLKFWHGTILVRERRSSMPPASPVISYSISRRLFFRFRLRASACFTRFFSPGFK